MFRDKTERMLREMMAAPGKPRLLTQSAITDKWSATPAAYKPKKRALRSGWVRKDKVEPAKPKVRYHRMNTRARKQGVTWQKLLDLMTRRPNMKDSWYAGVLGCSTDYVRATINRRGWEHGDGTETLPEVRTRDVSGETS